MSKTNRIACFVLAIAFVILLAGCAEPLPIVTPDPTPTPRIITDSEQMAIDGILALKLKLKDPNSFELHRAVFDRVASFEVTIDITAKNGFGGAVREQYSISRGKYAEVIYGRNEEFSVSVFKYNTYGGFPSENVEILDCEWIMENVSSYGK